MVAGLALLKVRRPSKADMPRLERALLASLGACVIFFVAFGYAFDDAGVCRRRDPEYNATACVELYGREDAWNPDVTFLFVGGVSCFALSLFLTLAVHCAS